jgi:hypothetical protein
LEQDALFLSDNEIFVTRNSTIQSLFDEVELRFETVRHTQFWSKLRPEQQWALHLYRWISLVTRRKICFGLSVAPQELGISSTQLVNMNNPRFYLLDDVEVPGVMELKHVLQSSLNYEHWYASLFGDLFMTEDFQVRNAEKLSQFLNGKPCWRYPPSELVRQLTPDLHHDQSAA